MFYVYFIQSRKDDKMYIGVTSDLKKRLQEHNNGKNTSTKYRIPFTLIYYEAYLSFKDAIKREKKLKQFKNSYKELKKRIFYSLSGSRKVVGGLTEL